MSKSVRPKNLTDKISFGLTAYFIVHTDMIFKIDRHVQKDLNISETLISDRNYERVSYPLV